MKKEMILITKDYPYGFGGGDIVFVLPEIASLSEHFRLSVISTSNSDEIGTGLNKNVNYLHYHQKLSIFKKIGYFFLFWLDICGWKEFADIIKQKKEIVGRTWKSIEFYACAEEFYKFINNNIDIARFEGIFYTFWCDEYTLSLIKHKYKNHKYKVVSRLHGRDLYNERYAFGRQPFKNIINQRVNRLFFAAELPRNYYLTAYPNLNINRTRVSRLGVHRAGRQAPGTESGKKIIISCSNIISLKRVNLIIEGLAGIDDIDIYWIHFGDGEQGNEIRTLAEKKLKGKSNIKYNFRGKVDNREVIEFYKSNKVSVFITTSSTEGGCPVSIMEAMSYGIPIIGTRVGDIPYMIDKNGLLLAENPSVSDISEAIREIMDAGSEKEESMRQASFKLWEENFNVDKNVPRFIQELEGL